MKKIFIFVLASVMALTVLAGCSRQTGGEGTSPRGAAAGGNAASVVSKPLPTFTYMYNGTSLHQSTAELFQETWNSLGFNVGLQSQEWAVFQTSRAEGSYTVCRHGRTGDYADPMTFLDLFVSYSEQNDADFNDSRFDEYIRIAKSSGDQAERMEAMHNAEKLLIDSYYVIPVFYSTSPRLDNGKVENAVHDPLLRKLNFKWAVKEEEGDIVYAIGTSPKSLDPALNNATDGASIIQHCFDGLTRKNQNYEVVPGIAKSWDVSEDGLTWTFHLRDANWSDGKPVTAADFEYAWKRVVDPMTSAEYANQMEYIENAYEIILGEKDHDELAVKALDDKTLEVRLAAPCGYFTELTSFPTYYPVRRDIVETNGKWAEDPSTYVVNGAYKIEEFIPDEKLVLVKNDAYWDSKNVPTPTVVNRLDEDAQASAKAFEAGEIDISQAFPPDETERFKSAGQYALDPAIGVYYICVNAKDPLMQDIAVRKALALSIDREKICETVQQGIPAYAFVPPGLTDADGREFRTVGGERLFGSGDAEKDFENAKQILIDAGYSVKQPE